MHQHIVEKHRYKNTPLSRQIAKHIYSHGRPGKIAIVADDPAALVAATRKQWLKLIRQAQNERSGTLNDARAALLDQQILWMHSLSFTGKLPGDLLEADVTFARAEYFVRVPPICRCVYVTYDFEREQLHLLTAWMPRNSLVILYEKR